jgi:hypothetical protein
MQRCVFASGEAEIVAAAAAAEPSLNGCHCHCHTTITHLLPRPHHPGKERNLHELM